MTASRIFALIATVWGAFALTANAQPTSAGSGPAYPAKKFRAYLQSEIARYTRIVKTAGLKAE